MLKSELSNAYHALVYSQLAKAMDIIQDTMKHFGRFIEDYRRRAPRLVLPPTAQDPLTNASYPKYLEESK